MSKDRGAAYGAPPEEKEIVVSIDRRLVLGVGITVLVVGALSAGIWMARNRAGGGAATAALPPVDPAAAAARATQQVVDAMRAAGLPTGAVVVPPSFQTVEPVATAAPGGDAGNPYIVVGGTPTFQSPAQATMAAGLGGTGVQFNEGRPDASSWSHDVLANFEDPNVTKKEYAPAHPDAITAPVSGPRLGIRGLNLINTFDYGKVPMDVPASHDFTMVNVGDQDLVVSRVYTGCGCTATRLGDVYLDNAGFLPEPMVLKPGEERDFTIEFDPRAEGKPGAQAKFIQIFSNDPSKTQFAPDDPNSHETRFRIVVEPAYDVKAPEGAKVFKVIKPGGDDPATE